MIGPHLFEFATSGNHLRLDALWLFAKANGPNRQRVSPAVAFITANPGLHSLVAASVTIPINVLHFNDPIGRIRIAFLDLFVLDNTADGVLAVHLGHDQLARREDLPQVVESNLAREARLLKRVDGRVYNGEQKVDELLRRLEHHRAGGGFAKVLEALPSVHEGDEGRLEGPVLASEVEVLVVAENAGQDPAHKGAVDGEGLGDPGGVAVDEALDDGHVGHLRLQRSGLHIFGFEWRPVNIYLLVQLGDDGRGAAGQGYSQLCLGSGRGGLGLHLFSALNRVEVMKTRVVKEEKLSADIL